MKKLLLIINPRSGKRHSIDIETLARQRLDPSAFRLEFVRTEYAGHAVELAADSDADIVVAVGGDGTVNEVARGLAGSGKTLGIIPTGSGNGLARHLGISCKPEKALRTLSLMNTSTIDCGVMNGRLFCCSCGAGLDADVSAMFASSKKRGLGTYIVDAFKVWKDFKPGHYKLSADGRETETDAVLVTVGNANQWGNNAFICPEAVVDDGFLDITIIKPFRSVEIPVLAFLLMTGRLKKSRRVTFIRGREVCISREKEGWAHFDGECIRQGNEIRINLLAAALKVIKA